MASLVSIRERAKVSDISLAVQKVLPHGISSLVSHHSHHRTSRDSAPFRGVWRVGEPGVIMMAVRTHTEKRPVVKYILAWRFGLSIILLRLTQGGNHRFTDGLAVGNAAEGTEGVGYSHPGLDQESLSPSIFGLGRQQRRMDQGWYIQWRIRSARIMGVRCTAAARHVHQIERG